jgi:hypothetical protein
VQRRWRSLWSRRAARDTRHQPDVQPPVDETADTVHQRFVEAAQWQAAQQRAQMEARCGPAASWPRLSETLTGPRHPHVCQSCGVAAPPPADSIALPDTDDPADPRTTTAVVRLVARERRPPWGVYAWQECDSEDAPEPVVVMLCTDCSARLILPHPRLYRRLPQHVPFVGIMALCLDCTWREGVRCTHPQTQANGGSGLELDQAPPIEVHVRARYGRGGFLTLYPRPVCACAGRHPASAPDEHRP